MTPDSTPRTRAALTTRLIGPEIPRLWCPPLTHYTPDGTVAVARMRAHWAAMAPYVGGFLVPGSTGDGWEMTEQEIAGVLAIAVDLAEELETRVLVGVLRTDTEAMIEVIEDTMARLRQRAPVGDPIETLRRNRIGGFTVCPPKGADFSQKTLEAELSQVLDLGVPIALYQLPQVTENEVSPALFADLAARYPNLILFKDTSGEDRVAKADRGASGVFLVRGAEGDYARWLRECDGPYGGLLLSTANSFPAQYAAMIAALEDDDLAVADAVSARLTDAVRAAFALVQGLPDGNPFANANKAVDHYMAYGPEALSAAPPPVLHAGSRLPRSIIIETGRILEDTDLMPERGYLDA